MLCVHLFRGLVFALIYNNVAYFVFRKIPFFHLWTTCSQYHASFTSNFFCAIFGLHCFMHCAYHLQSAARWCILLGQKTVIFSFFHIYPYIALTLVYHPDKLCPPFYLGCKHILHFTTTSALQCDTEIPFVACNVAVKILRFSPTVRKKNLVWGTVTS